MGKIKESKVPPKFSKHKESPKKLKKEGYSKDDSKILMREQKHQVDDHPKSFKVKAKVKEVTREDAKGVTKKATKNSYKPDIKRGRNK